MHGGQFALVLVILLVSGGAAAQERPIVLQASTSVPVSLEVIALQLRQELPQTPIAVAATADPVTPSSVTLAVWENGHLLVVYRDPDGRETARIVADTHDPRAVAAAVAMIVANLHRNQLDSTLAAIERRAAPRARSVEPRRAISPPPAPTPTATPALRAIATPARSTTIALGASPFVQVIPGDGAAFGFSVGGGLQVSGWDIDARFGLTPARTKTATVFFDSTVGDVDFFYDVRQTSALASVRRLLVDGPGLRIGAGVGLGLFVTEFQIDVDELGSRGFSPTPYQSSYLDAMFVATSSLDLHVAGPLWWSSQAEFVMASSSYDGWEGQYGPGSWLSIATGARLTL